MIMTKKRIIICEYESPCGTLMIGSYGSCLCLCDWIAGRDGEKVIGRLRHALAAELSTGISEVTDTAVRQLDAYFSGNLRDFDIPLMFAGTEFQRKVWNALMMIPYGTTVSYGELARRIGVPSSVRAVANANGANPISIFAPCHRVIGSDGSLTGYGGGLSAKKFLLELESGVPTLDFG